MIREQDYCRLRAAQEEALVGSTHCSKARAVHEELRDAYRARAERGSIEQERLHD